MMIVSMTLAYIITQGSSVWLFGLPILLMICTGFFNFCQRVLESTLDLEQPEIRVEPKDYAILTNTPALRCAIVCIFMFSTVHFSPSPLNSLLLLIFTLSAPLWLLVASLEYNVIRAFDIRLWLDIIKVLGVDYWWLLISLALTSIGLYYYIMHDGSFLGLLLALYLLVIYFRLAGLILRNNSHLVELPRHWNLTEASKELIIHNEGLRKYHRIIVAMRKAESDQAFSEKMQLLMSRQDYRDAKDCLEALKLMEEPQHAINFCQHYLVYLCEHRSFVNLASVTTWLFSQKADFLLELDHQNLLLMQSLVNARRYKLAQQVANNFMSQRYQSPEAAQIARLQQQLKELDPVIFNAS